MPRTYTAETLGYVPAQYHPKANPPYISFYVVHPQSQELKRKRIKLGRVKGKVVREQYARDMIRKLNAKLRGGWNPFYESAAKAHYTTSEALNDYLNSRKDLRHSSPKSYRNQVAMLVRWAETQGIAHKPIYGFTQQWARRYMRYVTDKRKVNPNTFNNYLRFANAMFNWLTDNEYLSENPFGGIKKRKKPQKERTFLSEQETARVFDYWTDRNPHYLLFLFMVYYALIRPAEAMRIQVKHVNLHQCTLTIPGTNSKSGLTRHPTLPQQLCELLAQRMPASAGPDHFIFGQGWQVGPQAMHGNSTRLLWVRMRDELGFDKTKKIYSLKDTGIIAMINAGVKVMHIVQQAGWKDANMLNPYVQHVFPGGNADILDKFGKK